MGALPIEEVLGELRGHLAHRGSAVLVAEPGAGKTTRVPLALLSERWLDGQRIVMLEPRRLAARSAARYMAATLGERTGETVGYRVRQETNVGPNTRIEVVTEGVLTRMLQSDPGLEGVGLVIFDEFHERSLHADLGLALCLQAREWFRSDLKILVMSATMEAGPVAALLGGAPIVESKGRSYPVETFYMPAGKHESAEEAVARTVRHALAHESGSILVFLPGAAEIRRAEELLATHVRDPSVRVLPLHGQLPQEQQDEAVAPAKPGERKVVLATSIAETSLTIEGVRVVIDSGLMRVPRFSPATGMTRLETVRVSAASADQRKGRAGRLGPGVCYRIWTEHEQARLVPFNTPEIRDADLAPLALELAAWGVSDPSELRWLDPPPSGAFSQARSLLVRLGAITAEGSFTAYGTELARTGLHPRMAHMVLQAVKHGLGSLACDIAALLGERDILRRVGTPPDADLRLRLEALWQMSGKLPSDQATSLHSTGHSIHSAACRFAAAEADRLRRAFRIAEPERPDARLCGAVLALAYPDRIGQARGDGRFLLSSGRGAAFAGVQPLSAAPYLVAGELDDAGTESRIRIAAPVALDELERMAPELFLEETAVEWDRAGKTVRARKRKRLGALIVSDIPLSNPEPEEIAQALMDGIRAEGLSLLPWTEAARKFQQRVRFMSRWEEGWPDLSDEALMETMDSWLAVHLYGKKSAQDLRSLQLVSIFESMLGWDQRRRLDQEAPSHITVPSGSRVSVDYSDPEAPAISVRLQEMFGMTESPRLGGGRVPLTVHLLSPAMRPVQVTRDLASFWREAYFEVKKDLKGRYPKHYWPDDPASAIPTRRTKPPEAARSD